MEQEQRKFMAFSERNMLRKVAAELDSAQRGLLSGAPAFGVARGCLERSLRLLGYMTEAGLYPRYLAEWSAAIGRALDHAVAEKSTKECFQAVNDLWHAIAVVAELPVSEQHFCIRTNDRGESAGSRFPCEVVLDNIRSAFNCGSMLRTADGFGVEKVWLTGVTAGPEHEKVRKTAMGVAGSIETDRHESLMSLIEARKSDGVTTYALETVEGAGRLFTEKIRFPACVIVGNEEYGVAENGLAAVERIVEIPMFGRKNSLNVGVSCAIFLYEARRQWEERRGD